MKITKYFTKYSKTFTICLREFKLGEITITQHNDQGTGWSKPTVNWAGCGAVSIDQTEKFIASLAMATYIAECLDKNLEPSVMLANP